MPTAVSVAKVTEALHSQTKVCRRALRGVCAWDGATSSEQEGGPEAKTKVNE